MSSAFTIGEVASVVGIAGGLNSMFGGGGGGGGGQAQTQAADPFAPYRGGLGAQYSAALQPGASANMEAMPGYSQWNTGVVQPAMQASQRQAAGAGQLYSGGEQQALQKVGQQGYSDFMTNYMNRLAQGSGAVNNPATAAGQGMSAAQYGQGNFAAGLGGISRVSKDFRVCLVEVVRKLAHPSKVAPMPTTPQKILMATQQVVGIWVAIVLLHRK